MMSSICVYFVVMTCACVTTLVYGFFFGQILIVRNSALGILMLIFTSFFHNYDSLNAVPDGASFHRMVLMS